MPQSRSRRPAVPPALPPDLDALLHQVAPGLLGRAPLPGASAITPPADPGAAEGGGAEPAARTGRRPVKKLTGIDWIDEPLDEAPVLPADPLALAFLLRVLSGFSGAGDFARLAAAPGSVAALFLPELEEVTSYAARAKRALAPALALAAGGRTLPAVEVHAPRATGSGDPREVARALRDMAGRLAESLTRGAAVVLLLQGPRQVPQDLAGLLAVARAVPPLSGPLLAELLRLCHPRTGVAGLRDLARLGRCRLPPLALSAALAAPDAATLAARLRAAAGAARPATASSAAAGPKLAEVHGLGEHRPRLQAMVRDLGRWAAGELPWSEMTASALLSGPPGTGKTMIARALAAEAGVPLIATSYADCQKAGHQGDMLAALSGHFDRAMALAPAVLFLDEIDSFSDRAVSHQGSIYMRGVVNGLLELVDRLRAAEGVILLGATNFPGAVDPALIRSGRFDLKLALGLPDRAGRAAILRDALGAAAPGFDLTALATRLAGATGADLAALVREARSRARDRGAALCAEDLEAALAAQGLAREDERTLKRVAVHEAGHVLAAEALGLRLPDRVVVGPRGGGVTLSLDPFETEESAARRIVFLLAGRVAEALLLGAASSAAGEGPLSDLARATDLALRLETEWGFGRAGLLHAPVPPPMRHALPRDCAERIEQRLAEAEARARALLAPRRRRLTTLAKALLAFRDLDAGTLVRVLARLPEAEGEEEPPEPEPGGKVVPFPGR